MTTTEQRTAAAVPAPRTGAPDDRPAARTHDPDRSRDLPRRRPRDQYWDVADARWRSARQG